VKRIALLAVLLPLLSAANSAPAAPDVLPPPIARPNPALLGIRLDYVSPLETPSGGVAQLEPLVPAVTAAAVNDARYLAYHVRDDLGGFVPAPVGGLALSTGGRAVVGAGAGRAEIPLFAQAASGSVRSFTFGASVGPPDNGKQQVPGAGVPPVVPPPTNSNTVPPPNQGFGGRPAPPPATTTTTTTAPTTTTTPKPPPTTTTATTPTTTTTSTTTTTPAPQPPPTTTTQTGGGPTASCGTAGIELVSDLSGCRIDAINMAPGDTTVEHIRVTNTSDTTYTLALKASGTQNRLWQDLRLGVWEQGTPAPSPLPPLLDWTTQYNDLDVLAPGRTITYVVELELPTSAGNADQDITALIDFTWRASG
jgi:hypothetical protein